MWDFDKLPESKWEEIKAFLSEGNIDELIKIHNEYELSEYVYANCCRGKGNGVINWFRHGLKEKKNKANSQVVRISKD